MTKANIIKKVKELKKLRLMLDDLAAEISTIEDEIKAEMIAKDTEIMKADIFTIRYTTVTSNRLDSTAIKNELPEIAARYMKQITTKRFSIA